MNSKWWIEVICLYIYVWGSYSLLIINYSLLTNLLKQITYGGVAQLARAPALQAGGQEFDSPHLHQYIEKYIDREKKVN